MIKTAVLLDDKTKVNKAFNEWINPKMKVKAQLEVIKVGIDNGAIQETTNTIDQLSAVRLQETGK